MNKKIQKNKACPPYIKPSFYRRGMSYVELIVVLSIFAVLSSVVIFNYGAFQDRVDIKNLASDIALKIVEAQKSSINGVLPFGYSYDPATWKPSYGVSFDISTPKQFIYFVDLTNLGDRTSLDTINITKNNSISKIENCSIEPCELSAPTINSLSVSFQRPNSGAIFTGVIIAKYVQITIMSPKGATALIKVYPSGRVQVN